MAFVLRSSRAVPVVPLSASRCPRPFVACQPGVGQEQQRPRRPAASPELDMPITPASNAPVPDKQCPLGLSGAEVLESMSVGTEREFVKARFRELHKSQEELLYGYDELLKLLRQGKPDLTENELQMLYSGVDKKTVDGKVSIEDFVDYIFAPSHKDGHLGRRTHVDDNHGGGGNVPIVADATAVDGARVGEDGALGNAEAATTTAAPTVEGAIAATRGAFTDATSARQWAASSPHAAALHGRCLAYFNGAFSPPTRAHAHIVEALIADSELDAVWLDPEPSRPGKPRWLDETLEARIEMCTQVAAVLGNNDGRVGVGSLRRDLGPDLGGSTELFHTLRALLGGPGRGRLLWVLGADVLEGMRYWAEKARSLLVPGTTCDGLVVFVRGGSTEAQVRETAIAVFGEELATSEAFLRVLCMPSHLSDASSHRARAALVAAAAAAAPEGDDRGPQEEVESLLLPEVRALCTQEVMSVYAEQVANTPRAAAPKGK